MYGYKFRKRTQAAKCAACECFPLKTDGLVRLNYQRQDYLCRF
jgi:hypothetical protein